MRSAFELAWGASLVRRRLLPLTGRSWSGAGPIARVDVSTDGGTTWDRAHLRRDCVARRGRSGVRVAASGARRPRRVMARATDVDGRQQPLVTPYNDGGYFFDAVVRHPVTVV